MGAGDDLLDPFKAIHPGLKDKADGGVGVGFRKDSDIAARDHGRRLSKTGWSTKRKWEGGLAGFAGQGIEAGVAGLEKEADTVAGTVALFGDIEFAGDASDIGRDGLSFAVLAGRIIFSFVGGGFPAEEHDDIGVLLDGT